MSLKLTKTQQYAILWMLQNKHNEPDIIKELKITEDQLHKFLEKNPPTQSDNNIKTTKSNTTRSKDMMIRKTSGKNNDGVSIMTKEASQVGDAFRQTINHKSKLDSIIHRPNG